MTPQEIQAALALARERLKTLLPLKDEGAELGGGHEPYSLRGRGIIAELDLYDTATYQRVSADLILIPASRLHEPGAALDDFATALSTLKSRGLASVLGAPIAASLNLPAIEYTDGMFAPDEETERRRRDALDAMNARFDAVAARMKEVYGLLLPRYLAPYAAFWRSLDELEARGMNFLGRSPGGIMLWFEDGGLERKTRAGLDPRLEGRFRCDPPEMVTIGWGDSDGLHFGLWYDDPEDPPTYIVSNYARDSAETWHEPEPTPLAVFTSRAEEYIRNPYDPAPRSIAVFAAREALAWFAEADREALAKDPPAKRWLEAPRIPTLGTFGPGLPQGAGSIRVGSPEDRSKAWRNQPARVRKWIDSAKRDCADGLPAAALTFGLDLHWLDTDTHRAAALDLMVMAYEKLGRRALAEIAKVHYAHRDLGSVGVFLSPGEAEGAAP